MKKSVLMILVSIFSVMIVSCGDDDSSVSAASKGRVDSDVVITGEETSDADSKEEVVVYTGDKIGDAILETMCKKIPVCIPEDVKAGLAKQGMDFTTAEKCKETIESKKLGANDEGEMECDSFDNAKVKQCIDCYESLKCEEMMAMQGGAENRCNDICDSICAE